MENVPFFFLVGLGFELRTSQEATCLSLKMGSQKLFEP
jgi:hypothetical protein